MAWELEIHHYDVETTGDATLIIAEEVPPLAVPGAPRMRSALIDGGRKERWADLHAYIGAQIGPGNTLSVLIVTHYCIDHLNGVTQLLLQPNRYNNTFIYDQGWPQVGSNDYTKYVRAINGRDQYKKVLGNAHWTGRTRVTRAVLADNIASPLDYTTDIGLPATPVNPNTNIDEPADWLLTGVGAPAEILWNGAGGPPVGAPQMRFIAANRYVRLAGGGDVLTAHTLGLDPRNEKSLAVEVTFGNFRYYIAGDIETGQENSIQALLNAANNAAGRVPAVKISHHGSSTSTSRAFIDRLRPEAAFISCGTANQHDHPDPEVVNVLDGFPAAGPTAGPPPNRPVSHFLTGYQDPFPIAAGAVPPPQSLQGTAGFTAGDPNLLNTQPGHIVVTVDAAQAARPRTGGLYQGVQAAANAAATNPALAGVLAPATALGAATAAAEAALSFDAASAASAFLNSAGQGGAAPAASNAADTAVTNGNNGQLTATNVTTAAMFAGAPARAAAGAGAAAGVVVGGVDAGSLADAVRGALIGAGLGAGAAGAAGLAAGALAANPGGMFNISYYSIGVPPGIENVAEI